VRKVIDYLTFVFDISNLFFFQIKLRIKEHQKTVETDLISLNFYIHFKHIFQFINGALITIKFETQS